MTYFPKTEESAYKCQGCSQWYIRGNVNCCVAHTPGTCCHYGDTPSQPPQALPTEEELKRRWNDLRFKHDWPVPEK